MRIYVNYSDRGAVSYYRAEAPVQHCREACAARGVDLYGSSKYDSREDYDVYYLPRFPSEMFLMELRKLKDKGKKFWWGIDDDYWHVPEWNPAFRAMPAADWLTNLIDLADKVLCSTEPLMRLVGPKAVLAPNLIDASLFPEPFPRKNDPVRVLWAGSVHHERDFAPIIPAIDNCTDAEFLFFGSLPLAISEYIPIENTNLGMKVAHRKYGKRVGFVEYVPLKDYWKQLVSINADIGLLPLEENEFNKSKSAIKYWEYSLAGMASLATPFGPYADQWHLNYAVCWEEDLSLLINNREIREQSARDARKYVLDNHSWQSQSKIWEDIFCE